jgi:hypothetical protein
LNTTLISTEGIEILNKGDQSNMQEDKSRTEGVTPTKEDVEKDATSKETVSDLTESVETSSSDTSVGQSSSGGSATSTPSPDGQFDSPLDGAGTVDETDPM